MIPLQTCGKQKVYLTHFGYFSYFNLRPDIYFQCLFTGYIVSNSTLSYLVYPT